MQPAPLRNGNPREVLRAFPMGATPQGIIGPAETTEVLCDPPVARGWGTTCLTSSGDKYFIMTGYFEVQDLRTVTVRFEATNAFYLRMVLGEMVNGVYTEVDQRVVYENDYTAKLVNKEPGTRFPVRIEYTPNHASGDFSFSMFVDNNNADEAGELLYFHYTLYPPPPLPPPPPPPPSPPPYIIHTHTLEEDVEVWEGDSFYGLATEYVLFSHIHYSPSPPPSPPTPPPPPSPPPPPLPPPAVETPA
jgi:hypothetical protein